MMRISARLTLSLRYVAGACPNDCSSHGTCVDLQDVSLIRSGGLNDQEFTTTTYSTSTNTSLVLTGTDDYQEVYTNWDAHAVRMCVCDNGFFGPDCSQSEYPC